MNIRAFKAVFPKSEFISSTASFFNTVKEDFPEYRKNGFFDKLDEDSIFIYQIHSPEKIYQGILTVSDIKDYNDGKIIEHELTKSELEQKQIQLLFRRRAVVKPILLTYEKVSEIDNWMKDEITQGKPLLDFFFEEEGHHHYVWAVSDKVRINKLRGLFKKYVPKVYIADGHHRISTSAVLYNRLKQRNPEQYRYFLSSYFSFSDLEIYDFNRVIEGLNGLSPTRFMAQISRYFKIKPLEHYRKPRAKNELIMCLEKEWYRLRWFNKIVAKSDRLEGITLDSALLEQFVLKDILGIQDVRNDSRIQYIGGPNGMDDFVSDVLKKENRVGFMLYPVSWEDYLSMGNARKIMPPKSTWFEPRMKNGVIVQEF